MSRLTGRQGRISCIAISVMSGLAFGQTVTPALRQADATYRAGEAALARRDLAAAQSDFEQVVRLVPGMEQGHSALGAVLLGRGHAEEAILELQAALAIKSSDVIAQTNLAFAYESIGQPGKAVPLFAAIESTGRSQGHPLAPSTLTAFARALAATGNIPEAVLQMKSAVASEPKSAELHDQLGSLYAQQHAWQAAQDEFVKAVQLAPSLAEAHLHLGLAMQAQGQDGSRELAQAVQLAPGDPLMALELGKTYAAGGQDQLAITQFRQVLARKPGSAEAMLQMALALQRLDQSQEALALLRKVVSMEPRNALALTDLGLALTQAQQSKEAVAILQRALTLTPGSAPTHEDLAAAYIQLNQLEDAIAELREAVKLLPNSPQIHYDLGLAFKMQDKPAAAIPELESAEKLDPRSPEAPYALGLLYMQAGRYAEAARELKTSLDLRPANGEGWATLGSVYNNLNMLPEATAALREATKQLPGQPDAHLTLAAVLIKQNQPAEATEERKKAADLMRANMNQERAHVATNAGNGLLAKGDLAGAAEHYHDALGYDPHYADAHLGLAKVLDAQGKALDAAAERKLAQAPPQVAAP